MPKTSILLVVAIALLVAGFVLVEQNSYSVVLEQSGLKGHVPEGICHGIGFHDPLASRRSNYTIPMVCLGYVQEIPAASYKN
jgi:hypothetical protein